MSTLNSLRERVVLLTGAARRVGAETARTLHAAGASVMIHYNRSSADAEALVAELNAHRPGSAHCGSADLRDVARIPGLIDATLERFGRLDVLVNNASTFYPTPLGSITEAQFDDLLGTNLKAPLFLSQAARPALRSTQGLILNIVDIHGLRPLRDYPVYSAAKAGLVMLTRALARELGPEIRVNGIAPGAVMWPSDGRADAATQQRIIDQTALKRSGSAADVARTALFFAADAPYVTGQILAVDGGRSVGS